MSELSVVSAADPQKLAEGLAGWLSKGWAPYGPVIGHIGGIGQLIVTPAEGEYRLLISGSFADFNRDLRSLSGEGYEAHYWAIGWNEYILQWMVRYRLNSTGDLFAARAGGGTHIVSSATLFHLLPNILAGAPPLVVADRRLVEFPSPVHGSTE